MDDNEISAWVGGLLGGPTTLERLARGRSRVTYSTHCAGAPSRIVRVDTGNGPLSGTELTLSREAALYAALTGAGVPVPALLGLAPDGTAMLLERAAGTSDVDQLSAAARERLYDDYLDRIADLHLLDVHLLDATTPGPAGRTAAEATLAELDLWERAFRTRVTTPRPVAELAFRMLRRLRPAADGPAVLCHGDVGPKNFMHDGERVTALIDWEFGHLGDPMDDLAWWVFRGHEMLGDCGDLDRQLHRWQDRTGRELHLGRLRYHRALVVLRVLVVVTAALDHPGPSQEKMVFLALEGFVSAQLVAALADLDGTALSAPAAPPTGSDGPAHEAILALRDDVDHVVRPAVTDPQARLRLQFTDQLVAHLLAADRVGHEVRAADLADLAAALGGPVPTLGDGHVRLVGLLRAGTLPDPDALELLWRHSQRSAHLWPLTADRALAPAHPLLRAVRPVG